MMNSLHRQKQEAKAMLLSLGLDRSQVENARKYIERADSFERIQQILKSAAQLGERNIAQAQPALAGS